MESVAVAPLIREGLQVTLEEKLSNGVSEKNDLKLTLEYTATEARRELAVWLGHNPHRMEVTYAYVSPRENHFG